MGPVDKHINGLARGRRSLVSRQDVLDAGGTDDMIASRLATERWTRVHGGVYEVGVVPPDWRGRLQAAVLAAGESAAVSHRAALVLWGLDGLRSAPVEITVPYTHAPLPDGVIVHRSRRPVALTLFDGIAVTSIERTIVDAGSCLPPRIVEMAMESAFRRNLTTPTKLQLHLEHSCGRGVRGTAAVRGILASRPVGRAAGSPAESLLIRTLREMGAPDPVRQFEVRLRDGTVAVADLAWPSRWKLVEVDGVGTHGSPLALDYDLERQNLLLDGRWEVRRYSARRVMRKPEAVARSVIRFLGQPTPVL